MRERVETKAKRYLAEERLTITDVRPFDSARPDGPTQRRLIKATCRGSGQVYRLGFDGSRWWCDCPALSRRCAHILALQQVTTLEARGADAA
jgi:hypothetical protein